MEHHLAASGLRHELFGAARLASSSDPCCDTGLCAPGARTSQLPSRFRLRDVPGYVREDGVSVTRKVPDEKGPSDVNVASHLLIDIHSQTVDAAVLISNDGDLRLPSAACSYPCADWHGEPAGRVHCATSQG